MTDQESPDTAEGPYKILIIGNSGVGKTAFLVRYKDNTFLTTFSPTVGVDFGEKTMFRQDKQIKLQIWDTAGQERYRSIATAYFRGAMGFLLMFDLTNEQSFQDVQTWSSLAKEHSEKAKVVLVGNKNDLKDIRVVQAKQGLELAESMGVEYVETSAKDDTNVKKAFEMLLDSIFETTAESTEDLNGGPEETKAPEETTAESTEDLNVGPKETKAPEGTKAPTVQLEEGEKESAEKESPAYCAC